MDGNELALRVGYAGYKILQEWTTDHEMAKSRLIALQQDLADIDLETITWRPVDLLDICAGYSEWASTYDRASNPFVELAYGEVFAVGSTWLPRSDERVVLDAGVGTGQGQQTWAWGGTMVALDLNLGMLDIFRAKNPRVQIVQGDMTAMPLADHSFHLIRCGFVLSHLADVGAAFAEFARVVEKNGRIEVVDVHPHAVLTGANGIYRRATGSIGCVPVHRHLVSTYLHAASANRLHLSRVEEICWPANVATSPGLIATETKGIARPIIQAGEPALLRLTLAPQQPDHGRSAKE
ncbi:class I SAM-dependent methyltransferase [Plantactinospora sp. WMMB782]|uniref:class I SAM-dependent methyltransferase n=1 Tax=Plantactinospora sp. WMMB782 TaxID=3404121 RepID=UPI003B9625A8